MYLNRDKEEIYIHTRVFVHFQSVIHIKVILFKKIK